MPRCLLPWGLGFALAACAGGEGSPPETTKDTAPQDPPATTLVPATLSPGVRTTCADPAKRGVNRFETLSSRAEPKKKPWFWGDGAIVGDFDSDGLLDMILPGLWETMYYRSAAPGELEDISERFAGMGLQGGTGGVAADFDGDGDLDVFLTRYQAPDVLLANDGTGHFTDVSEIAGISDDRRRTISASFADFDRDGDLDLFVGGYGFIDESDEVEHVDFVPAEPSFLYENQGDGTFRDRSNLLPDSIHPGYTFTAVWHDFDDDGWLDLYVVNDFGDAYTNQLIWNRKGTFVPDDHGKALDVPITGMGVGLGDVNSDGVMDVIMTAWNGNHLLQSSTSGIFVDYGQVAGVQNDLERGQRVAWGVEFVDMDNDGDLDAPMTYGYLESTYIAALKQPDALYEQVSPGQFEDRGAEWGVNYPTIGRGFVAADFNLDGYLDLVVRDLGGPTLLHLSNCGEKAYLALALRQPGANQRAVGSRVTVTRPSGQRLVREVFAGGVNHASGGPATLHFGLDLDERVDVHILWPDGEESALSDVPTRALHTIERTGG